jgi:hypothetical protein
MLHCRGLLGTIAFLTLTSAASAQPGGFPGGPPGGFGGPFIPPQPGQVLSAFQQEQLKLTAKQRKDLETLQKEVDAKLATLLTTDQNKQLQDMRKGPGFGPPGGGFGGGGFGGGGPKGKFGPGGGFGPPGGGFGGGFGGNPLDNAKKQLDATDEEWKVISVKLQKVISARQALTGVGGAGAFGGPPGGGMSRVSQARAELKTVLDDPKHTPAEVADHITAVRKAQQQARTDLDAAQKDLVQMLTARQEAVLVSLGYLD